MAEKGPTTTVSAKQMAMSRALGAAFLTHQVEQLEKSVVARGGGGAGARGGGGATSGGIGGSTVSGNWRERSTGAGGQAAHGGYRTAASQSQSQSQGYQSKRAPTPSTAARSAPAAVGAGGGNAGKKGQGQGRESPVSRRKSSDEERDFHQGHHHGNGKDADVVVVDASVLVHALYQVKRWCREGREEIVIVPLEALNTLDLLKKGTSSLAQRARAASRILEAQVGTNPRIRVQQDDAFVYWDKIPFSPTDTTVDHPSDTASKSPSSNHPLPSPEWVRRTICCVQWEVEKSRTATLGSDLATNNDGDNGNKLPRIVLAVLSPSSTSPLSSPQSRPIRLSSDGSGEIDSAANNNVNATPVVPLPAPAPGNKFEPRSAGTLVGHWAARAGIKIIEVEASAPGHSRAGSRREDEEDTIPRGGKTFRGHHGGGGHGRRKPSIGTSSSGGGMIIPNGPGGGGNSGMAGSTGLVERPPAVMAMMEMVSQPNKGRVVRVLARGEKLDP